MPWHPGLLALPSFDKQPQWVRWALAVGAPVALYWLLAPKDRSSKWFSGPVLETDFDSFLYKQGEHPTGLAPPPSSKAKGKKKGPKLAPDQRGKVSGTFDTFLKVEPEDSDDDDDPRDPVDFNSFLKTALKATPAGGSKAAAAAAGSSDSAAASSGPKPEHARVLVMFGTEYGFSKEIAEKLCAKLRQTDKYWPVLEDMADHPEGYALSNEQAVFMACSTQGDGVPPTEAREFCEWLFKGGAGKLGAELAYSVCALGDKSYQHFCRCGKLLDKALGKAGAHELVPRVDVNKEDWGAVDGWIEAVVAALATRALTALGASAASATGAAAHAASATTTTKKWGKSRPYGARVVAVEGLCAVASADDKATFRVELDLGDSGLAYAPGDALGIYARNGPEYVEELVRVLGADGAAPVPTPSWHYEGPEGKPATLPLREALAACYDLKQPKAELFQALWQALPEPVRAKAKAGGAAKPVAPAGSPGTADTKGLADTNGVAHVTANGNGNSHASKDAAGAAQDVEAQAVALASLIAGGSAAAEAYFGSGRHVVDVLKEFAVPAKGLGLSAVLATLKQLQPRLYSISSSPLEGPAGVQATIAEVKYTAHGAQRIGVCSTFVSERIKVGDAVPVYIHKNPDFRLPPSPSTPILMVGPGTGLAPFRAFIQHRLLEAGPKPGQMVLYFGCRRRDQDYLYGPVLEGWAAEGAITLFTAFSREKGQPKVYVQDRLRQSADLVWSLMHDQGGHFYVCGDASSMAGCVEAALLELAAARLSASEAEALGVDPAGEEAEWREAAAKAWLDGLSASQRYQRDVWY